MRVSVQVLMKGRAVLKLGAQAPCHAATHIRQTMETTVGERQVVEQQPRAAVLVVTGEEVRDECSVGERLSLSIGHHLKAAGKRGLGPQGCVDRGGAE